MDALLKRALGDGRQEFGSFFLVCLFGMKVCHDEESRSVTFAQLTIQTAGCSYPAHSSESICIFNPQQQNCLQID